MNTRRDFIKTTLALGAGATLGLPALNKLLAVDAAPAPANTDAPAPASDAKPDLVAVRDGTRAAMLDRAIDTLGGMSAFVKKGQKVVIKPNIGWDKPPEICADTHPDIVARLVTLCLAAGAAEVAVFDHTCDEPWDKVYQTSGIAPAAKAAGARLLPANSASYYREVKVPGGVSLKTVKIHTAVLDSDVFINAPVLKHHGGELMTACMKNLMGMVWDRGFWHGNNLDQCIVDILRAKKPDLNILDAYSPMARNGPQGNSTADLLPNVKTLFASTDIVAIDAAGARTLGHDPAKIRYIRLAAEAGLGRMDLEKLNIARIKLSA